MEKPPVLSDERIKALANAYDIPHPEYPSEHYVAKAQRDKDVEWYGDMIVQVTERSIRAGETALNKVFKVQQKAIQQARQDTARELIEEIEKHYSWIADDLWLQSLKSKYLIPPNPVGSADV